MVGKGEEKVKAQLNKRGRVAILDHFFGTKSLFYAVQIGEFSLKLIQNGNPEKRKETPGGEEIERRRNVIQENFLPVLFCFLLTKFRLSHKVDIGQGCQRHNQRICIQ